MLCPIPCDIGGLPEAGRPDAMKTVCWNVRGLCNPRAMSRLRRLIRERKPDLLFLSETKLKGARVDRLKWKLGFTNGFGVHAVGLSGGLQLLWNENVDVTIRSFSKGHIDALIEDDRGINSRFTGFYGEANEAVRHLSWELLRRIHNGDDSPWMCAGDFNEVLFDFEHVSRARRRASDMSKFAEALEDCGLVDLGFQGELLTWNNMQSGAQNVQCRLDRACANPAWKSLFPAGFVEVLDYWGSDHRVLLIGTEERPPVVSARAISRNRWAFEPGWLADEDCEAVIRGAWLDGSEDSGGGSCVLGLTNCKEALRDWARTSFGHRERRIRELSARLERINKAVYSQATSTEAKRVGDELESLLLIDEHYWKQRARVDWLKGGDKNSAYFHSRALRRKSRNTIRGIQNEAGEWVTSEREVRDVFERYFLGIFSSNGASEEEFRMITCEDVRSLSEAQREFTCEEFSGEEVEKALFSMGPRKAPGPDGFHAIFFQKFWKIVGPAVKRECLGILNGRASARAWNATNIVLIPKVKNPTTVKDFRPISLCNVILKIVTKVVANRVKEVLPFVISDSQSAFVPGRLITDNAAIAYELLHSIKMRTKGKKGVLALKLDMSKAYDRVEWGFILAMLRRMGFGSRVVDVVRDCISSPVFSVVINGTIGGTFAPKRGLRQGCPLSPYLFLLCAEGFSALIRGQERLGLLRGFACRPAAPSVSHLLFADDSILFCEASDDCCHAIRSLLVVYERGSGQVVNMDKSAMCCSRNITEVVAANFSNVLHIPIVDELESYLGILVHVGRNKVSIFSNLTSRVHKQLRAWRAKKISAGGREVLVKAVVQAIPTYTMSLFKIPPTLIDELHRLIARFWWGGTEDKIGSVGSSLLRQRRKGGLGSKILAILTEPLWAGSHGALYNTRSA